jgi:succinate dehydrogenase/fumarate reductase flavoprotein subunit
LLTYNFSTVLRRVLHLSNRSVAVLHLLFVPRAVLALTFASFVATTDLDKLRNANGKLPTAEIRLTMQKHMQDNAAVYRTQVIMNVLSINSHILFANYSILLYLSSCRRHWRWARS